MRTARGREATEKAYKHLGRTPRTGMGDGMLFV
jgi:Holliday junction resolvasome RuvABC ATP-dependent DNA helicase subunit